MKANTLTVEYREHPIGLDVEVPRFSWRLQGEGRGLVQQAYQLQVGITDDFIEGLKWDSDKVVSSASTHIEYEGAPLEARTRYFVRVRVWDATGQASDWSDIGSWETGLMTPDNWSAAWVSAGKPISELVDESAHYLRKEFQIHGSVRRARLYATAKGIYELRLNGEKVGDLYLTPGWTSYQHRLQYQTFDVTSAMRSGANVVGMMLADGWYKGNIGWEGQRQNYGNQRLGLVELHLEYEDGRTEVIGSDGSWTATTAGPILMAELYHGETYDARIELGPWDQPGYDDRAWSAAQTVESSKAILTAQENEGTRVMEELKPIAVLRTPRNEKVLDFGQNMVGWVRFRVSGAKRGQKIRLIHGEVLSKEGNFYTDNLRSAKQTITYVCKGEETEVYEPRFTFQGFRYVKVEGYPGEIELEAFTGKVLYTAMASTGSFECSHPLLNQLQSNIVWGQRGNFLDIPTDCPQRDERLGWTGDAQVFIRTASFNMQTANFFTKWLRDLKADQRADGAVPHVIPDMLKQYASAAWGDAATVCPWTVYQCFGDKRVLEEQYDSMKAWVDYIRAQGEQPYLWNTGQHFGDWLGLDAKENSYKGATPEELIATAFYAYSTELVAKTAEVLGCEEDHQAYREQHTHILKHFRDEFLTPSGRLAAPTQTTQVLALMFGLVRGEDAERAARTLAQMIERERVHMTTGFVGTPYICHVLSRYGYNDLAYQLVQQTSYPSWLYSVEQGATTIWEHWDGIKPDGSFWSDAMNSYNHYAYGAVGDWMYRVMAGLDLDEAEVGYRKLRIAPQPGPGITYARARYESLYGPCGVNWQIDGGEIHLEAEVAPNTTAVIVLPRAVLEEVSLDGDKLRLGDGVVAMKQEAHAVELEVGSGSYRFTYPWS